MPKRKTKEEIEREVKSQLEKYMSTSISDMNMDLQYCLFFNNFHSNFPYRPTRRQTLTEEMLDDPGLGRRDLGRKKTLRQFYQDIDTSIQECGLDEEQMKKLSLEGKEDMKKRREYMELIFPVYITLLSKGYSRSALIG